jgi:ferredoxin
VNGTPPDSGRPDAVALAVSRCTRCGLCMDSCPTYRIGRDEGAGPRGRIMALSALGRTAPHDDTLQRALDGCMGCRLCLPVCPTGVPIADAIAEALLADPPAVRETVRHAPVEPVLEQIARLTARLDRPAARTQDTDSDTDTDTDTVFVVEDPVTAVLAPGRADRVRAALRALGVPVGSHLDDAAALACGVALNLGERAAEGRARDLIAAATRAAAAPLTLILLDREATGLLSCPVDPRTAVPTLAEFAAGLSGEAAQAIEPAAPLPTRWEALRADDPWFAPFVPFAAVPRIDSGRPPDLLPAALSALLAPLGDQRLVHEAHERAAAGRAVWAGRDDVLTGSVRSPGTHIVPLITTWLEARSR